MSNCRPLSTPKTTRAASILAAAMITGALLLQIALPSSARAAATAQKPQATHAAAPTPAATPPATQSLDSMTRDGSSPTSSTSTPDAAAGQSMNIGGAVLRTLLSLGAVLALVVGAIKYLKRKGYGAGMNAGAAPDDLPVSKPSLGVSPFAQMLLAVSKPTPRSPNVVATGKGAAIDDFEVLGTQPLPGSNHTLYKVRVGDRILLLGGSPSGALNVLTEWESEFTPEAAEQNFGAMLGSAMDIGIESRPPASAARLQGAADRLTAAIRQAGNRDAASAQQWKGFA